MELLAALPIGLMVLMLVWSMLKSDVKINRHDRPISAGIIYKLFKHEKKETPRG